MTTGFRSVAHTDAGAVALTGQIGQGIAWFDYVLDVSNGTTGFQKVFTASNVAVYRARAGSRYYMRVDDTNATYCLIRIYESMSDASTGTNIFPTTAQVTTYAFLKSATADSTPREYNVTKTDRWFAAHVRHGTFAAQGSGDNDEMYYAGDPFQIQANDPYCFVARFRTVTTTSSAYNMGTSMSGAMTIAANSTDVHFARNPTGNTIAQPGVAIGYMSSVTNTSYATGGGSFAIWQIFAASVVSATLIYRARLPFIFQSCVSVSDAGLKAGDVWTDSAGASYVAVSACNGTTQGLMMLMISDNEVGLP